MIRHLRFAASAAALTLAACAFAPLANAEDQPAATAPADTSAAAPPADPAAPEAPAETAPPAEAAPPAAAVPPAEATPPATPAATIAGGLIPPPPAGRGQVVFFRKGGFVGAAITYKVRENGTAYGTLSPGKYFVVVTDPGKHTYEVHSEAKDNLSLEVDDGETYFVEGTVAMGVMVGRPNISPSNEAAFTAVSKKLKLAKPEPATTTTAAK